MKGYIIKEFVTVHNCSVSLSLSQSLSCIEFNDVDVKLEVNEQIRLSVLYILHCTFAKYHLAFIRDSIISRSLHTFLILYGHHDSAYIYYCRVQPSKIIRV